ncbi:MAG: ATP-dependent RNA helicase HrpA [Ilumatobacteraceae bacterium]
MSTPTASRTAHGAAAAERRGASLESLRAAGRLAPPASLPIAERWDDLIDAIREHQVVIVAGETGSGKSTQLPKACLELGRGVLGLIGHTQPRRVAARTIAERVAEELAVELGGAVGYTVRFTDHVAEGTLVKVMTDGILLAEIQRDRMLRRYDTIIIDEAHERSLNIDFLLGYLAQLLPRRPDLKVIVTSATIDTERFAAHFATADGTPAPVITVSGRTFPVEVRYRPFGTGDGDDGRRDDRDQVQAVSDAIDELASAMPGDVLVFLSGEREIHDVADHLRRRQIPNTDVLPLYARLSAAEQHRIFQQHAGRRIVLSTNVAETSLTVPGVRTVVDAGAARISRYSHRLKVQRLPIEPVSQASANQRAGRCGRVAPGICIRLYAEDDFVGRPEFTEPEILRTNLASVILQMTALGLGDVAAFPFLDPPDARAVRDGYGLLEELGAIVETGGAAPPRLTETGKRLARLPVDPRLGRMVLEADRHGCVREVLVIASALSIQDPRERPVEHRQAADEMHRRFQVEGSDFLALVRLWDHLRAQQQSLSNSQFRKLCRTEYLNYLRVREWQDLYSQLRQVAGTIGVRHGTDAAHPDRVHQAMLAGLLSHLGVRDGTSREYRGAHQAKFAIVNGSVVAKKLPRWVMAGELVETNRLWARTVATVQPEWAEHLAPHLVKRSYGDPRWDPRRCAAVITERVTLYGLPIVTGRAVAYDRIDAADARDMFVRHALVEGDWEHCRHTFIAANRQLADDLRRLGDRVRRVDVVDDEAIVRFYDSRVPAGIVSGRHFDRWWKTARADQPELLTMTPADLVSAQGAFDPHDYPGTWRQGDLTLDIVYRFDPGAPDDGVTVLVPVEVLNRVRPDGFDWQVPGVRDELVAALVKSLPKDYRKELSPLADTTAAAVAGIRALPGPTDEPFVAAVGRVLTDVSGVIVPPEVFQLDRIPPHLQITFTVTAPRRQVLGSGTSIADLRTRLSGQVRAAIVRAAPIDERRGITTWDFGTIEPVVESEHGGIVVRGYPALVDDGDSVSLRVLSNEALQTRVMRSGLRRLLLLNTSVPRRVAEQSLGNAHRLALSRRDLALDALLSDCVAAVADRIITEHDQPVRDGVAFDGLVALAKGQIGARTAAAVRAAADIATAANDVDRRLERLVAPAVAASADDARAQLARLVRPGFVTAAGVARLPDILRYVRGIDRRLEKLLADPARDQQRMRAIAALEGRYATFVTALPASAVTSEVIELGWMFEELRIAEFAQVLGNPRPVSVQRIMRELTRLGGA